MDYTKLADTALIKLIANRDQNALEALIDRYGRLVYSMAYASVGQAETAQEISQEVFIRIWQKSDTYDPDQGKVMTWMASITRYRSIDVLRRLSIRPEGNLLPWDLADMQSHDHKHINPVEDAVDVSLQRTRIRKALAHLPENQQLVISLAYFRGMSNREISEHLGEPLGTVKTRIRLGMQKLRSLLEQDHPDLYTSD